MILIAMVIVKIALIQKRFKGKDNKMSSKIPVSVIDEASSAFDRITDQYVYICEQIGD